MGNSCQDQQRAGWTKSRTWPCESYLEPQKLHQYMSWKKANVEPLERRRSLKILIQGEKLRRLPSQPLHTNLAQSTKNRLKRQSLNHQYKELSTRHQDIVDVPVELLTDPAWKPDREAEAQMFLTVPGITSYEQLSGELRNLTLPWLLTDFLTMSGLMSTPMDLLMKEWKLVAVESASDRKMVTPLPSQFLVAFSAPNIQLTYWPFAQLQSTC